MNHSSLNGSISSGHVSRNVSALPRPTDTHDREAEFFSITARNWLIHQRYVRKEFDICKLLIEEELQKTRGYNEYANYVLGLILRHEGKIQESMEYFKKCHTLNPKNIENIKQVAQSLFLLGRHELAVEAYLQAERSAETPDWNIYHNLVLWDVELYNTGECYLMLAQLGKAREYLSRAVQLGKSETSYQALAQLYEQDGDLSGAIDVYTTALEIPPEKALQSNGHMFVANIGRALTSADYKKHMKINFDSCDTVFKITSQRVSEHSGLLEYFLGNITFRLFPGSSDLAVELGLLLLRSGDYQKAFNWLGYALAHNSTCTSALLATGAVIQKHEEYDTALAKYKMAAQHRPESAALWNNVGMCFFGKKKYIAAISCLKMANYLAPLDWRTLYNLGLVHLTCRQYASSFTFLSACVKLRHRHAPSFMLLAMALMHLEDPDNAGKAWEQAVKLDPEDPGIRANYAAYWAQLGVRQRALEQLNVFNRLAQQTPNICPEILELVKTLTAEVTKDVVPHASDQDAEQDEPQDEPPPEDQQNHLQSDEV